ncbi:hypothetical protein BL253_35785 [Pseudofrankia asymbiotica]|uniref:Uncharacterized protein n=1 Tax=Pseudofrankia asymbiotica TaxID=1834516 RepID=A0A1V2I1Y5_9ACTN|nr:hypothetical protein BL253_35785 [Pseudofrankia asymbiotica]
MLAERDARAAAEVERSWHGACELLSHLAAGRQLPPLTVWGLVLHPGEQAYLSFAAGYSRYYSGDGTYTHVDGLFLGSLPFMAAGYAFTAMGNNARRSAAAAEAAYRWREHQRTQVVLTSERVVCNANGRWLSFYFSGVTAFYPEPMNWSVVFEFGDAVPLRLVGESGAAIATYAAWALHGRDGLHEHPALEPLRAAVRNAARR